MKSRMLLPALVAVGFFCMATASSVSAFELLNRMVLGGGYSNGCGCEVAPTCGCDDGCGRTRGHHHRNRCCKKDRCAPKCGCEMTCAAPAPKCGHEMTCAAPAPKCGCEVSDCGCGRDRCREPRCCREKCRQPRCKARNRCEPKCGCEVTCAAPAPKCGCGA